MRAHYNNIGKHLHILLRCENDRMRDKVEIYFKRICCAHVSVHKIENFPPLLLPFTVCHEFGDVCVGNEAIKAIIESYNNYFIFRGRRVFSKGNVTLAQNLVQIPSCI